VADSRPAGRRTGRVAATEVDPLRVAARVCRPVLVAHGTADRTFLPETAKLLFDAIAAPKELVWLEGYDHYGAAQAGDVLWERVFAFFARQMGLPTALPMPPHRMNGHRSVDVALATLATSTAVTLDPRPDEADAAPDDWRVARPA
jgi:hypothetical protein